MYEILKASDYADKNKITAEEIADNTVNEEIEPAKEEK